MRKYAFKAASVLALVSAAQLQAAQAKQAETCLTRPELHGMVTYALPTVLDSAIETCSQSLKPDSYMLSRAPRLLTTLEAGRAQAWPMAKAAFLKLGDEGKNGTAGLLAALPEEAVRPLVDAVIVQKLGEAIKPESCGDIDRVMAPLEPLPASNLIAVLTEAMTIAGRNDQKLRVCQDS